MEFNLEKILEYQKNRPPFLMIDHVDDCVPGKSAKGYKKLSATEWFLEVHWPGDPNMPGVLQVEAMVQMASMAILSLPGNKGKALYLTHANKLKFFHKILPNSKLVLESKILNFKRGMANCSAQGYGNDKIVCKAEFCLILPEEIKKYTTK